MSTTKKCTLTCTKLDDFGKGICYMDGKTVFVDNLLPGESADVETIFEYGKLNRIRVLKRLNNSPYRVKPLCKYYQNCGGCSLQHLSYEEQLKYKQQKVKDLIKKFAKIEVNVEPTIGLKEPLHFRNKVQVPLALNNKTKKIISGFYQENTHKIIPNDECLIESTISTEIRNLVLKTLNDFKIQPYDRKTNKGTVRHVLIKVSEYYNSVMLCFVTATDDLYGAQNIIKTLLKKEPRIKTVVQNINKRDTNVILGEKTRVLYGTGQIKDRLCGLDFLISAKSFYQTNSKLTETLYNTAINALQLTKEDTVLDAYCGTGTIGLAISKYVKEVVGVEIEHSSILDAEKNKKINNIENISFIEDDCTEYLMNNCEEGNYSAVVMDPPRAGSTKEFIAALEKISPRQIVYISCDPVTLARDLGYFTNYEIKRVIPVDMFPHTFHVETVVLLSRKNGEK